LALLIPARAHPVVDNLPFPVHVAFERPESYLVIHLLALLDPVAQIHMVEVVLFCVLDLLHDRKRAQPSFFMDRIKNRIYSRDSFIWQITNRQCYQLTSDPKFHENGLDDGIDHELAVASRIVMVHGVPGMAPGLITAKKVEVLLAEARRHDVGLHIMIAPVAPLLAPAWSVFPDRNAYRNTGIAGMTMRFIDNIATTTIARLQQYRKLGVIERVVRLKHEG